MSKLTNPKKNISNALMIPIILMIGFVPLIVHTFSYRCGLSVFDWFPNASEEQVDVFFAWKMFAAILVGASMLVILLFRYFDKKEHLRFENSFYLLFFYALFVAMSALFSPYKRWVALGTYELFEAVWAVFAYIVLCYYAYQYVQEKRNLVTAVRWSGVGMLLVTLIGVFQYYGKDFFKTSLGRHLITSPSFWDRLDTISFVMGERTSYTTLYNPNFLSFYFGMLIPLAVCLAIASKKLYQRLLMVLVAVLACICMIGSHSDSGWMALAVAVGITVLILLSRTPKTRYIGVGVTILGIAALAVLFTRTSFGTRLSTTILGTYHMEDTIALHSFEVKEDYVDLNIRGNHVLLLYTVDSNDGMSVLTCTDENGTELAKTCVDEGNLIYQLDDPMYEGLQVQPVNLDNMLAIRANIAGRAWDFAYVPGDGFNYANSAGKLTKDTLVKKSRLFREDFMSGRGHIWNCTLPLLGKHIFIGVGANAYMLAYPQNDYIYHAYISGTNNYDVKAHCWYLQQWVENGLIGLLLLLGFIGWYVVRSVRIYRRADLRESLTWVGIGFFVSVLVYLIAAIANDSNVCTAPVFWGVLGLGMAVNRMIAEHNSLFAASGDTGHTAENADQNTQIEASDTSSVEVTLAETVAVSQDRKNTSTGPSGKKKSGKKKSRKKR